MADPTGVVADPLGTVKLIAVRIGDSVRAGDVLLAISVRPYVQQTIDAATVTGRAPIGS